MSTLKGLKVMFSLFSIFLNGMSPIEAAPQQQDVDVDFRPNAELVCYECARTPDNDTCAIDLKQLPKVTAVGQGFRCRVYEMDGHVVARGIVPSSLCTPQAFAQINLNIAHLAKVMNANGPVHASCCNQDLCNVDYCTSEGRAKDCSTLVSVLNGQLASYVDSEIIRKQVDFISSKGSTVSTGEPTSANDNNLGSAGSASASSSGSSGSSDSGSSESSSSSGPSSGNDSNLTTTGSNSTTEPQFEIVDPSKLFPANASDPSSPKTNVTASSKLSSSLQQDSEAALEPLMSRKNSAPAIDQINSFRLIIAIILALFFTRYQM